MNIKYCTEQFLQGSGLNYTIFRLCGFMQVRPLHGGGHVCDWGGQLTPMNVWL